MVIPNFNSKNEANKWLKNKICSFVISYEKANNAEGKQKALKDFSLNDFKAEEIGNPLMNSAIPINQSEDYIKLKNLLNDFFIWTNLNKGINPSFEIYLDQFFSKSHAQKMPLIAENIKRMQNLSEIEQVKTTLEIYKTLYETSLNHLKTLLEIIFSRENKAIVKDFGINDLSQNFKNYPRIQELLNIFDNYSRNPIGHDSWTYEEGILLFKSKGAIKKVKIPDIVSEIVKHIMFHMAYQALAIERFQEIVRNNRLTEQQMNKIFLSFKNSYLLK